MRPPAGNSVDDSIRAHTIKNERLKASPHHQTRGLAVAKAKNEVNRSEAIREALAQNPEATSKEIVSLLSKQGVRVRRSLVYTIKSQLKLRKRRRKRKVATAISQEAGAVDPVKLIMNVKDLASQAGGVRNLKQLVDALAE
jgi:hypothetical protein